jgi:hypothetical protein
MIKRKSTINFNPVEIEVVKTINLVSCSNPIEFDGIRMGCALLTWCNYTRLKS